MHAGLMPVPTHTSVIMGMRQTGVCSRLSLGATMGKVSENHRTYNNANVETEILSTEFIMIIPLDNNLIIIVGLKLAPYLFAGFAQHG